MGCQAAVVGVALGLLDDWLPGHDPRTPSSLAVSTRLPAGHWVGERAVVDVRAVALPSAERLRSLDTLTARHVGQHVLYGSAFALTATLHAWAQRPDRGRPARPVGPQGLPEPAAGPLLQVLARKARTLPRFVPDHGAPRRPGWVVRRGAGRGGR